MNDNKSLINIYENIQKKSIEDDISLSETSSNLLVKALKKVYFYYYQNHGYNEIEDVDIEGLTKQEQIIKLSKVIRLRAKQIKIDNSWWQLDSDVMLVFDKKNHHPWVLIPSKYGTYTLFNIEEQQSHSATIADAELFEAEAFVFYPQLPEESVSWKELFRFLWRGSLSDLRHIFGFQIALALLGFLFPILTGVLINEVIPNADYGQFGQIILFLVVALVVGGIFFYLEQTCLLRFTIKTDYRAQGVIWDRLIRLKLNFFRDHDTGDLINRVSGISEIQQILSGSLVLLLSNIPIMIGSIIIMFIYSSTLAFFALLLMVIMAIIVSIMFVIQKKMLITINKLSGKIEAFLMQMIACMQKIRITNSEHIFFRKWLRSLQKKYHYIFLSEKVALYTQSVYLLLGPLTTMAFFMMMMTQLNKLSIGGFVAFSAAYAQLYVAIGLLINATIDVARIIPLFQRIKPILSAVPEGGLKLLSPKQVTGRIQVSQLSFRYQKSHPYLLEKLDLVIEPGQHVAIVAATGTGKSTLLRLLLGLERPEAGQIFYDGIDLQYINLEYLRQHIGVVLQNNRLMAGTIADNISGFRMVNQDLLWEAAKLACIDKDINDMPMGMKSYVDENGSLFSGGQRQRILLARALCHKPKMLFLDEATSSLDNLTQAEVQRNLNALNITRITVAHRMSAVMHADRIFVMDKGQIVQHGTYQSLLQDKSGLFYTMTQISQ